MPANKLSDLPLTDEQLLELKDTHNLSYEQIAQQYGVNYNLVRMRVRKARKRASPAVLVNNPHSQLFNIQIAPEPPLVIEGDAAILSDIHVPCTNLTIADYVIPVCHKYLPKRKRIGIINGDLFSMDAFSFFAQTIVPPTWKHELLAAKLLVEHWLSFFDELILLPGNHERRLPRMLDGNSSMEDVRNMLTRSNKVRSTEHGHVILRSGDREFRVTHGRQYSVNTLWVGNELAHKFNQHIISGHQHHGALGMDRYKRFIVMDVPALVDQNKLAYVTLDDSKMPNMGCGFGLVKDGEPMLFMDGLTIWDRHV